MYKCRKILLYSSFLDSSCSIFIKAKNLEMLNPNKEKLRCEKANMLIFELFLV